MEQEKKKRKLIKRLKDQYRLVIMNDSTFEEKISLRLSPLSLFISFGSLTILFIIFIISTIAFTPLREYIPGYTDVNMRRQLIALSLKSDSLEKDLIDKTLYLDNLNNVISGKIESSNQKSAVDSTKKYKNLVIKASKEDSLLRSQIEAQDKYSLSVREEKEAQKNSISNFFFFTPIKGIITTSFNSIVQHYGIDIVAPENEAIKATLDGTVILSTWTSETGYVIQIQHANNLVSVYKHNSALLKKAGDYVKAGEPIAIIGNSGEQTTGPHLHFELWYNGNPIDPQDYMVF